MTFKEQYEDGQSAFELETGTLYYGFQTHLPRDVFTKDKRYVPYDSIYEIKQLICLTPIAVNNEDDFRYEIDKRHRLLVSRADKNIFKFSEQLIEKYAKEG